MDGQVEVVNPAVQNSNMQASKITDKLKGVNIKPTKLAAIIIGLVISIAALAFSSKFLGIFSRASDIVPRDVVITDITENSAKVVWSTAVETQGVIEYGTTPTSLNFFAPETQKTKKHEVELTLLSPGTTYYFQIRIGDKVFDNAGVPWSFTTKSKGDNKKVVKPTLSPTTTQSLSPTPTPTPYQTMDINSTTPTPTVAQVCDESDCDAIKSKLGKGCTTQDYIKCLLKLTGTPTPTPTGSLTPTPTSTPTPTPSQ